ncbi:major facilitator superfamily domain-containing protein [Massariosphaeria phaeospora]|uniref:Major facilitator superfamily domain-containing protein n=1 Tax=Massariosphaeria phaeospora TaxID=100035 RepID=A0A7C8HYF5_9PLEO|nr:major facilitator superfamily domain-containing protein [Massariosphaeria phaeospora]
MSHEHNGSTPGHLVERNKLTRANTFPSVEFTIPPSDPPEQLVARCHSHQTRCNDVQAREKSPDDDGQPRLSNDAESQIGVAAHDDEVTYPEGGREAWLVVLGSFFGTMVAFGMMNTIGIFHQYVSEHQLKGYNESTIGWIFSVYVFLAFFCGIQIGPIFDARGPKMLIVAGSVFMCASMLLLGLCTQYWHFMLVFGVLGGIGTSLIFTPAISAVSHFFLEKRGNATGIAVAGGSVGGVIFPLTLQRLLPRVGFAWATRVVGFIFVFCCTMAIILIRSRLPPKPGQTVMPDLRIFRHRSYLLLTVGIYFMEWALFVPIAYLASFATSTGVLTPAFSYQLIAIMNAGSCIGRWAPGYIADKLGRFNSMIGALALCTATTLTLWLPASILKPDSAGGATTIKALAIAYALIFGFASGSNISLTPVCVGQLCETNEYGRYYATCYTIVSFGTLTGIPIAGSLIQATGGHYWAVVVWTLLCYIVSLGCFIWSRACCVGWKLGVKF